jgi:hypothetical protein
MMARSTIRKPKVHGLKGRVGDAMRNGKSTTGAAATATAMQREEIQVVVPEIEEDDPIRALIESDDSDIVSVKHDDIVDKALNASRDEFRKAFRGRAISHTGVAWRPEKKRREGAK